MPNDKKYFIKCNSDLSDALHYKACGLDDVYLLNGYTVEETEYGKMTFIEDLEELHDMIGLKVATGSPKLTQKEFRFLRKRMGLTQAELAVKLRMEVQTIGRYERGEINKIPGPSDLLLRIFYVLSLLPEEAQLKVLRKLQEKQNISECGHPYVFEKDSEWHRCVAA